MARQAFYSKVAGVSKANPDGVSRQDLIRRHCRAGKQLLAKREAENPHDPNAISLWVESRSLFGRSRHQIGYLKAELAKDLAKDLARGSGLWIVIDQVTGGAKGKETLGVNIRVQVLEK